MAAAMYYQCCDQGTQYALYKKSYRKKECKAQLDTLFKRLTVSHRIFICFFFFQIKGPFLINHNIELSKI